MNCNFKLGSLQKALLISVATGAFMVTGCSNHQTTLYESGFSLPNTYTSSSDFTGVVTRTPIVFENENSHLKLAGIIFRPQNVEKSEKLPTVMVAGPMYAPKEQTQSLYAQKIAALGYETMVFDYSYIGSSEGEPRGLENPKIKVSDIKSAISYLEKSDGVIADRIGVMGICGSGGYMTATSAEDKRIKALIALVPYTLMDGIHTMSKEEALEQKAHYEKYGTDPEHLALIEPNSEGATYYHNYKRGASANYIDAVAYSQLYWWQFQPIDLAPKVTVPTLVLVGETAFSRDGGEKLYKNLSSKVKELHVIKGSDHFSMYDQEPFVSENMSYIEKFLKKNL